MLEPLDRNDFESRTWARLTEHMKARRDALRRQMESDLDMTATARLRGRIAELKELLSLPDRVEDANT